MSLFPIVTAYRESTSIALVDDSIDTTNVGIYTFNSQAFGAADDGRYLVAAVTMRDDNNGSNVESCTIGGVSATQVVRTTTDFAGGGSASIASSLWIAYVPTGTTGSVVATMSTNAGSAALALYRLTGIKSPTAFATDSDVSAGTIISMTMNTKNRGVGIGISNSNAGSSGNAWVGLTETVDTQVQGGGVGSNHWYTSAALTFSSDETPRAVTVTPQVGAFAATACIASWEAE